MNACFLTGSFSIRSVVFEATIFVGQSKDGGEVRCEVSRRVKSAVSRHSGPSGFKLFRPSLLECGFVSGIQDWVRINRNPIKYRNS